MVVAAGAHHHLEAQVERNLEHLVVVHLVAGNIGNMPHSSDNRHKRHKDLDRHRSIGRSWQHNPLDCGLLEGRASLAARGLLGTALLHMTRSHLRSLDDHLLAGSRNRAVAVDSL